MFSLQEGKLSRSFQALGDHEIAYEEKHFWRKQVKSEVFHILSTQIL